MSGPIVRTGTTPAFGDNWDRIFGGGTKTKSKATAKPKSGLVKTTAKVEKVTGKAAGTAKSVVAKTTSAAKSVAGKVKAKAGKK